MRDAFTLCIMQKSRYDEMQANISAASSINELYVVSTQNNNMLNTESQMGCLSEKPTADHIFTLHLTNKHGESTKAEENIYPDFILGESF